MEMITMMINVVMGLDGGSVVLHVLAIAGLFPTLVGMITMYHWFRPQHTPADKSNRINAIRLWWFALTREELFVDLFPWLKNDELENVTKKVVKKRTVKKKKS